METIKVQYTVKPDYVETNKQNIARAMVALRNLNRDDIKYSAFLMDDGQTFVHFVMRASAEAGSALTNLPEFQQFQQALRASQPISPPKADNLSLVETAWDIF